MPAGGRLKCARRRRRRRAGTTHPPQRCSATTRRARAPNSSILHSAWPPGSNGERNFEIGALLDSCVFWGQKTATKLNYSSLAQEKDRKFPTSADHSQPRRSPAGKFAVGGAVAASPSGRAAPGRERRGRSAEGAVRVRVAGSAGVERRVVQVEGVAGTSSQDPVRPSAVRPNSPP